MLRLINRQATNLKSVPFRNPLLYSYCNPLLYPPPNPRRPACLKSDKQPRQAGHPAQQTTTRVRDDSDDKERLHCSQCHYPITRPADRIEVNAKHEHVFVNPHGYLYQIGCFARAPGCLTVGPPTDHFTWFPGYTWRIAICGRCSTLLGWAFQGEF